MQYSNFLVVGLVSLGRTVTATGNDSKPKYECSLTETLSEYGAVARCPRLPPHANECAFDSIDATTTGKCPGTMLEWWTAPAALPKRSSPEPTTQAGLRKHSSVTMTVAAGGSTLTLACKDNADEFSDCSALTDAPLITPKPVLPVLAKRSFTTTKGPCTVVCKDKLFNDCDVHCFSEPAAQAAVHKHSSVTVTVAAAGETATVVCKDNADDIDDCHMLSDDPRATAKPDLQKRDIVTVTNDGCTAVCWNDKPSPACDIQCDGGFAAQVALPTPKPTFKPVLQQRGLTTTHNGCTAVCWDQFPGTGCDILCHDSSITKMPEPTSGIPSMWTTTFTSLGCTFSCQDLYPGSECAVQCPGSLPTRAFAPVKAARATPSIEARKDLQARQAREARLARKFGLDAHDGQNSYPSAFPSKGKKPNMVLPVQQEAVLEAASALSEASVAIAEAVITSTSGVVLPSAASVAMSQAASFLSSVSQTSTPTTVSATLTGTAPVTLSSEGTASILFPASTGNSSVMSPTLKSSTTAWWSSILATLTPTPTSTSVSIIITNGSDATTSTIVFTGGAPYESHSLAGMLLLIMIGVISSVAFMV